MMQQPTNGAPPPKKLSVEEAQILAKQAGEMEALAIRHSNTQVVAGIITGKPVITEERAAILVAHAEDRARMTIAQLNEEISLKEIQAAARTALLRKHARELEAISLAPVPVPAQPSPQDSAPEIPLPPENSSG